MNHNCLNWNYKLCLFAASVGLTGGVAGGGEEDLAGHGAVDPGEVGGERGGELVGGVGGRGEGHARRRQLTYVPIQLVETCSTRRETWLVTSVWFWVSLLSGRFLKSSFQTASRECFQLLGIFFLGKPLRVSHPGHTRQCPKLSFYFCALTGCTSHKIMHPEIAACTLLLYSNNK